jgi:hypothetical protein
MCDQDKCTPSSGERLRDLSPPDPEKHSAFLAHQDFLRELRQDLLHPDDESPVRVDAIQRLFTDLTQRRVLWFDRLGHVTSVAEKHGEYAGMVELVLCLANPDDWPPECDEPEPWPPRACERKGCPGVR